MGSAITATGIIHAATRTAPLAPRTKCSDTRTTSPAPRAASPAPRAASPAPRAAPPVKRTASPAPGTASPAPKTASPFPRIASSATRTLREHHEQQPQLQRKIRQPQKHICWHKDNLARETKTAADARGIALSATGVLFLSYNVQGLSLHTYC
jgi:hypothetical protein